MNNEGQRWKAQQESRGASAEVERRPESRVRLSGTGSKMDRDGASTEDFFQENPHLLDRRITDWPSPLC